MFGSLFKALRRYAQSGELLTVPNPLSSEFLGPHSLSSNIGYNPWASVQWTKPWLIFKSLLVLRFFLAQGYLRICWGTGGLAMGPLGLIRLHQLSENICCCSQLRWFLGFQLVLSLFQFFMESHSFPALTPCGLGGAGLFTWLQGCTQDLGLANEVNTSSWPQ